MECLADWGWPFYNKYVIKRAELMQQYVDFALGNFKNVPFLVLYGFFLFLIFRF